MTRELKVQDGFLSIKGDHIFILGPEKIYDVRQVIKLIDFQQIISLFDDIKRYLCVNVSFGPNNFGNVVFTMENNSEHVNVRVQSHGNYSLEGRVFIQKLKDFAFGDQNDGPEPLVG